jgi:HEAT repeat protein
VLLHPRFKSVYVCELLELLQDEEAYIRIEALEIVTKYLDHLEREDIEGEYVNEVLRTLNADVEEIQTRIAEAIGPIIHKLSIFNLHIKYREEFLQFYKVIVNHKEVKMRRYAAYNLPCFNKLLKEYQDEVDIDFNEVYLRFSKEEDPEILKTVAASLHEAFSIMPDDEDSQKLRDAFKQVIEVSNRETICALCENLDTSLQYYCNTHATKTYAPLLGGPKEEAP